MNKEDFAKFWFGISDKIRFLIIGSFNFAVSYIIYSLIIIVFGKNIYQISLALSWIISSIISFMTQRYLVFNVKGDFLKQYCKCCITWFFSYLINAYLLKILVSNYHQNVFLSQIFANFSAAVFTYIMFKVFAFRKQ